MEAARGGTTGGTGPATGPGTGTGGTGETGGNGGGSVDAGHGPVTMVQAPATEMAISPIPETVVETSTAERDQVPATAERITAMVVRRTGTATSNKRAAAHLKLSSEGVAVVASPLPSPSLDER